LSDHAGKLSLSRAFIDLADPAKLKRFDSLAEQFGLGRNLFTLLSKPGGSSEHVWNHQYELTRQGKDSFRLCSEIQELFGSLIADFVAAGAAGRFTATGFLGFDEKTVPPKVFDDPGLRLRLDEDAIELSDGTTLRSVGVHMHDIKDDGSHRREGSPPKKRLSPVEEMKRGLAEVAVIIQPQMTVKERHALVLRHLGIKDGKRGYGYETFRTKVISSD